MAKDSEPGGWSDYIKQQEIVRERTAKLKALRLAKEASEGTHTKPPAKKSPAKKSSASKKGKTTNATLADWLDDKRKDGLE